jgi:gliding motility-associated-like protein
MRLTEYTIKRMTNINNLFSQGKSAIAGILLTCLLVCNLNTRAQNNCGCWINKAGDTAWHVAPFIGATPPGYRNDDLSTGAYTLAFPFCFWGTTEDSVYINNNGDITFGSAFGSYTANGFPSSNVSMIAPFWADVQTNNPHSGLVYYKSTPTYFAVQWDTVGYFDTHADKRNSFQVVISNGSDPIIPYGNNVQFCYQKMQWTTGDANSDSLGFDNHNPNLAVPATVGANKGDGVNFIQIGLFGRPGSSYAGQFPSFPFDGVSWLNNQSFFLNTCSTHLPPIPSGVSPCDTFVLCTGDTVKQNVNFLSIISTDTINGGILAPIPSGVTLLSDHKGNTDSLNIQMVGNTANYGYHTVTLYGYDNETPADTAYVSFVLEVDSNAVANITVEPISDSICPGDSAKLKIVYQTLNKYLWSTGQTTDSIYVKPLSTTTYTCNATKGKCNPLTLTQKIVVKPVPYIRAVRDSVCPGDSDVVTVYDGLTYLWSNGSTQSSIRVKVDTSITYSCISLGAECNPQQLARRITVVPFPQPGITGNTVICTHDSTVLGATGGLHYLWTDGTTTTTYTPVKFKPVVTTTYTLTAYNVLCSKDTVFTITVNPRPVVNISGPDAICAGAGAILSASGGGTYAWSNNATTRSITVSPALKTTYKVLVDSNGCTDSAYATVAVDVPLLNVCCNDSLKRGDTVHLTADSSNSYNWNPLLGLSCFTCPNPIAAPEVTTTYTITGTDSAGCVIRKTITIEVYVPCGDFQVPTVFTPNNDGINDDLVINTFNTTSFTITIFDRWGKQVFYSTDPNEYWNGRINGTDNLAPEGVYYYTISASCGNNNYNKKGFVELLGEK